MKKLLLALVVLIGSVLPGIAQSCEDRYDLVNGKKEAIYDALFKYDLECLQYFVNEKNIDIAKETKNDDLGPAYYALVFDNNKTLDILSFLIEQKVSVIDDKPSVGSFGIKTNLISFAADRVASSLSYYKNTNALPMRKLELLLEKGGEETWQAIHDDTVARIVYADMTHDNINLVQFLIDQNMPLSEYDRYIQAIEKERNENLKQIRLNAESSPISQNKILEEQHHYVVGREILESLERSKEEKMKAESEPVMQGLDREFHEINEKINN